MAYDGNYNPATEAYTLNMPVYTQRRLNGEEPRRYVYLYSELSSVAMEQVIFNGPQSESPAQFVVTWSQ